MPSLPARMMFSIAWVIPAIFVAEKALDVFTRSMNIDEDLRRIALQEQRLQFDHFNATTAWNLGNRLKEAAEARQAAIVIDIP